MRRFILSILILFTAACSDDSTGPDEASIVGTYALQTAAGERLPARISGFPGVRLEVTAGSLTLNPDLTFSRSITWRTIRVGSEQSSTETDSGTYERNNDKFLLNSSDGTQDLGWVIGRMLKVKSGSLGFTFEQ